MVYVAQLPSVSRRIYQPLANYLAHVGKIAYIYIMIKELILEKIKKSVLSTESDAQVILFGSKARNADTSESDWDILVLLNRPHVTFKDEQRVRNGLFEVELEVEEPISTFVYSLADWNTKMSVTPPYNNVKLEGIAL